MDTVIYSHIKLPFLNVPFKLHIFTRPVNMAKYELCTYSWEGNGSRKTISKHPKKLRLTKGKKSPKSTG